MTIAPKWLELAQMAEGILPYNPDVVWNGTGYAVMGAFTLLIACAALVTLFWELTTPNDNIATKNSGGAKWKFVAFCLMVIHIMSSVLLILSGFFFRVAAFWLWAMVVTSVLALGLATMMTSRYTVFRVLQRVQSKKTLAQVLGGPGIMAFIGIAYVVTNILILVGVFGTAAVTTMTSPLDVDLAIKFWRIECVGVASWAVVMSTLGAWGFHAIAREIERVTNNVKELRMKIATGSTDENNDNALASAVSGTAGSSSFARRQPSSNGSSPRRDADEAERSDHGNATVDSIQDQQTKLVRRLDNSARNMLLTLPFGCALFLLHATTIPFYWFLVFPHLCNGMFGALAGWYANTTPQRRAKVLGRFIFLIPALAKESSEVSPVRSSPHHVADGSTGHKNNSNTQNNNNNNNTFALTSAVGPVNPRSVGSSGGEFSA